MTLKTYKFAPGIDKENTRYANEGRWWSMDKMRFRSGTPEKIGGWQKATFNRFSGVCRAMFNWADLSNNDIMALGTNVGLYSEVGGGIFDITPLEKLYTHTTVPSSDNCLQSFVGSLTVRINIPNTGAAVGNLVAISGAEAFGGIAAEALNKTHVITNANDSYVEFQISDISGWGAGRWGTGTWGNTSSTGWGIGSWGSSAWGIGTDTEQATGGGTAIEVGFVLPEGNKYAVVGTGWGAGTWGRSTWGSGISTSSDSANQIRLWSFDNFGENLLANVRGGQIYYWEPSQGFSVDNRAFPLANLPGASDTPLYSNVVVSTDDRHVVAFGANPIGETYQDPLLIRWCAQENPAAWTITPTNTAGDIRVPLGSYIVDAIQTRQETLVFTDSSVHSLQYVGAPYTFGLQTLADNTSIIGPNASITVNNVTYWMGTDKFYAYSGRVETLPCSLRRFVFSDINVSQGYQVFACTNEQFGEVMWFYCTANSMDIDRYVVYNYLENIWYYGSLARSYWLDSHIRGAPFATSYDEYMYQHEFECDDGSTNPPSPIYAFIVSADFDIDDGDKFSFIKRIIPDITFQNSTTETPSVLYTLRARNFPGSPLADSPQVNEREVSGVITSSIEEYTNQVWVRVRGRQAVVRVESSDLGVQWQLGATRLDLRPDGRR